MLDRKALNTQNGFNIYLDSKYAKIHNQRQKTIKRHNPS